MKIGMLVIARAGGIAPKAAMGRRDGHEFRIDRWLKCMHIDMCVMYGGGEEMGWSEHMS